MESQQRIGSFEGGWINVGVCSHIHIEAHLEWPTLLRIPGHLIVEAKVFGVSLKRVVALNREKSKPLSEGQGEDESYERRQDRGRANGMTDRRRASSGRFGRWLFS